MLSTRKPGHLIAWFAALSISLSLASCATDEAPQESEKLYIVGQDLGAIRGYLESDCCAVPDGGTAYLGIYAVLDPAANYGGLGVDADLNPIDSEEGWGAGPVSAWKTAQEVDGNYLAIGLDMTGEPQPGDFKRIADGAFDAQIDHLGRFIKATGKTTLLRIGYEFDGVWNPPYADHAAFIATWRHIVDRLRAAGPLDIQFVWQGSASPVDDLIEQRHEDIARWYPGDDYVDWVGTSWFLHADEIPSPNNGQIDFAPMSHRAMTQELIDFAKAHDKPVFIAELSPQGYDLAASTRRNINAIWDGPSGEGRQSLTADQIWQSWFAPFLELLESEDSIQAIAYINADWDSQAMWGPPYDKGYWGDTRLETNPEIAARWNAAIANWRGNTANAE